MIPFLTFVPKFYSPHFFSDAVRYADFEYFIGFSKFGKNCRSRPIEIQLWPILTVFVILCGVQFPR